MVHRAIIRRRVVAKPTRVKSRIRAAPFGKIAPTQGIIRV
jgi:hypothetical protein